MISGASVVILLQRFLLLGGRILQPEIGDLRIALGGLDTVNDRVALDDTAQLPHRFRPIEHQVPLPGHIAGNQIAAHNRFQIGRSDVMLQQR